MIHENGKGKGSGKSTFDYASPRTGKQHAGKTARHTKDVSDASLAEFEQLMAAMGYRGNASETENFSVRTRISN